MEMIFHCSLSLVCVAEMGEYGQEVKKGNVIKDHSKEDHRGKEHAKEDHRGKELAKEDHVEEDSANPTLHPAYASVVKHVQVVRTCTTVVQL